MDVGKHYEQLSQHSAEVLKKLLMDQDSLALLTVAHNAVADYEILKSAIADRPEAAVFTSAVKEYQLALSALSVGSYRHAFVGLRLFYEMTLATIHFSAHEIFYRLWTQDKKDIVWSVLIDADNGVLAKQFVGAFNPSFSEFTKQYRALAETVYRECSEFVHGNALTHEKLPDALEFDKEILALWQQKAETIRLVIVFAFSARYLNYVTDDSRNAVEPIVIDTLGHLPPVQGIFSK